MSAGQRRPTAGYGAAGQCQARGSCQAGGPVLTAPSVLQSNRPRVLFVNHTSKMGGGERILLSILQEFDGESAVWMFEDGPLRPGLAAQACQVVPLLPQRPSSFSQVKRDKGLIRGAFPLLLGMARMSIGIALAAKRFEIIYANSQKAFVLSALAAKLARRPLIWHLHDILIPAHFGKGHLKLLRRLAPLASRIIVPSIAAADAALALGLDPGRVRVIPNGVTLSPDDTEPASRDTLRRTLGLPVDGFLFGVFSRLSPWKGQDMALRALASIPGVTCVLAGAALFGETGYEASLKQLASDLAVTDRVRFLGNREDVPALMRAMDAVVHPSTDPEPFGRTLVEAMLCRVPIIATDTGAAREILANGEAGTLIAPSSPVAIVQALAAITDFPDLVRRQVAVAEHRALTDYTEQGMRDRVLAVVRELAPATTAPRRSSVGLDD